MFKLVVCSQTTERGDYTARVFEIFSPYHIDISILREKEDGWTVQL